jgi:hypothetical protein
MPRNVSNYVAGKEYAPSNPVKTRPGSSEFRDSVFEFTYVLTDRGASNARVTLLHPVQEPRTGFGSQVHG